MLLDLTLWRTSKHFFFFLNLLYWTSSCLTWWSVTCCCWCCGCYFLFWNRLRSFHFFWRRLFLWNNESTSIVHLRLHIFFSKSKCWIDTSSSFFRKIVTSSISTVKIIVSLEPLRKLKVILVLRFGKFFHLCYKKNTSIYLLMPTLPKASWRSR